MLEKIKMAIEQKQSLSELNQMLNDFHGLFMAHRATEETLLVNRKSVKEACLKDNCLIQGKLASLKSFIISSSWNLALEYAETIKNAIMVHANTFAEYIIPTREPSALAG